MAKKFTFRLEPVLKLRNHKVDEAKNELNHVKVLKMRKEFEIEEKTIKLDGQLSISKGTVKISELQASISHREFLGHEIKKLNKEKQNLQEIEELKRKRLSSAMKDEKVLVNLKEKQIESHKEDLNREEVNQLNEIAQNRHKDNNFRI